MLLFSLLIFLSVLSFGLAILLRYERTPLAEKIKAAKSNISNHLGKDQKAFFLDTLWNIAPVQRERSLKTAVLASVIAFVIGLTLTPEASLVFAACSFVLAPRIRNTVEENRQKKLFFKQFPRAVSELAAVARTGTILDGFIAVKEEHPSPVRDVFGYIAESIASGTSPSEAIRDAQQQFNYPGLDKLGNAIRIINELGGGEKASETLTSAADHIRFLERIRGKIDASISGLKLKMLISTCVIVGYFFLMYGPWTGQWYLVQKHPVVVLTGFIALGIGWYLSLNKIQKFKNTNYV